MEKTTVILENAQQRAKEMGLPYSGVLFPAEAYTLLQVMPGIQLIDVRSKAELDWVGRIPHAIGIELRSYPDMQLNPDFLEQLSDQVDQTSPLMFLCRSGVRSSHAATLASQANFTSCYNILEGFEGEKDEKGHRGTVSGWKAAALPWEQS
ncbi:thiosulfate sulfurtransferase [Nitrosomonas cryotolerans]|uniref:Thiosulfate sulfurtransferase n=1 Tax=Nitrosomonas cryotolerans ATCC 49181 TaxID=1131553 RepID=A0A1N6F3B8_9PROT|nr:rhodanese-like domain-containing protein [Nitrosomonas cryotolerans]SFP70353.1 thiosulfate sulfurtransferase [Nitrosomonas cryotolerans]SIN89761.1 thiosulfate sulfurtransferase [Nitrosomonas cryotolerans ATCC 49181]